MSRTRVTWTECLLTSLLAFGIAGTGSLLLLIGGLILLIRSDTSLSEAFGFDLKMIAFAAGAATLAGTVSWRLIVRTPDSRPRFGALAGLVVGFAAHPLCWFLILAYQTALDPSLRSQSAYDVLFSQIFMTLWMSVSSLGLVGWVSMPLGAAIGYLARRIKYVAASGQ
jgi:hypothetical protein